MKPTKNRIQSQALIAVTYRHAELCEFRVTRRTVTVEFRVRRVTLDRLGVMLQRRWKVAWKNYENTFRSITDTLLRHPNAKRCRNIENKRVQTCTCVHEKSCHTLKAISVFIKITITSAIKNVGTK